jgi:2-oxoglutarate ferredoxin oxidoreductase subunit beta
MYAYGFHATHGRALPVAQGIKMGNADLTVVACGGDGDGFAIGMGHTIHAMKRNMDITYVIMDNQIYGLTKGQISPRSQMGFVTKTTPGGSIEPPVAPLEIALIAGATFVAQGFSQDLKELTSLIEQAMAHQGFAFVNVYSPCVTYNRVNTYQWFRDRVISVNTLQEYNTGNRLQALKTIAEHDGLLTGLLYQDTQHKSYQQLSPGLGTTPLAHMNMRMEEHEFKQLLKEFI